MITKTENAVTGLISLCTTVNNQKIHTYFISNLQSCDTAISIASIYLSKKDHLFGVHQYFDELGRICPLIIFDDC